MELLSMTRFNTQFLWKAEGSLISEDRGYILFGFNKIDTLNFSI